MPRFTGKQLAGWLYDKRVTTIEEMSNISKANRERLSEHYEVGRSAPVTSELSKDGTRKYLFAVSTGGLVEWRPRYPLHLLAGGLQDGLPLLHDGQARL